MELEDSIWTIFESLLGDEEQKRLMKLIIQGKTPQEITEELLGITKKTKK